MPYCDWMKRAKLTNGTPVKASDLALRPEAGIVECRCEHCGVEVYLAAYRLPKRTSHSEGTPHFRTWPGKVHSIGCEHYRAKAPARPRQVPRALQSRIASIDLRPNRPPDRAVEEPTDEGPRANERGRAERAAAQDQLVARTIWRACEIHFAPAESGGASELRRRSGTCWLKL